MNFAEDFGQTALSSVQFLKGNFAGAPNFGIFGNGARPQLRRLRSPTKPYSFHGFREFFNSPYEPVKRRCRR